MDIASTPLAPTSAGASPKTKDTRTDGAISSDFETFLRMLTVQMQNQDPLNPMKSEDFAVQLATFSGVEQQVRTNDLLAALGDQMGVSGLSGLAGWVGMEVRAEAPAVFEGTPIPLTFERSAADQRVLVVRNELGTVVQREALPANVTEIEWPGRAPDGTKLLSGSYSFEVENYLDGALSGTSGVSVYALVEEARIEGGRTVLVTEGGGLIDATDVTALRQAPGS